MKHTGSDQLLLIARMIQGSVEVSSHFSSHPAAAGSFFTLLLFGLKLCDCLRENGHCNGTFGASLLRDHIHRYVSSFQLSSTESVTVVSLEQDAAQRFCFDEFLLCIQGCIFLVFGKAWMV